MKIITILQKLKQIRYMRKTLKQYSDSLVRGNYLLLDNFRSLSLNMDEAKSQAKRYFCNTEPYQKDVVLARWLNKMRFFRNPNKKTTAEYEAVYTANNFDKVREVKLFSFSENKVLVICTDAWECDKQLAWYDKYSCAYNMPKVEKKERYKNAFEISMINVTEIPSEASALEAILRSCMNYNQTPSGLKRISAKELTSFSYHDQEIQLLLQRLYDKIEPSCLELELPLCMQHGDLSKENLMYGDADGKTGYWWIDWEHIEDRVFFYDFFFYILNSAMYHDDDTLNCYLNGEADVVLKEAFSYFGLNYIPEKKTDYLLIFAIIFLKERVCEKGNVGALKKYVNLILGRCRQDK